MKHPTAISSWSVLTRVMIRTLGILGCWTLLAAVAGAQRADRGGSPPRPQASPSPPRTEFRPPSPEAEPHGPVQAFEPDTRGGHFHFGHHPVHPGWGHPFFADPTILLPPHARFGPVWAPLPPIGFPGWYQPLPFVRPPAFPGLGLPQSVLIESQVVANPPLAPARIRLENSARRELEVAVVDLVDSAASRSFRIAPGEEVEVSLTRDSGAQRVAWYQTYDAFGFPITQEVVTDIAPAVRYEVVVHEWAVQSVAIDRTGKSPNPIEDINMQGRGIGRFPLPAGEALHSGTIDVYREALAAENPGAVGPLVPAEDQRGEDNASVLERAILDAQRRAIENP